MKKWSKGDLQSLAAASRFLAGFGLLVGAGGILFLVLGWEDFISALPKSIISQGFLMTLGGLIMVPGGFLLSNYVRRYEKETGESSTPFS